MGPIDRLVTKTSFGQPKLFLWCLLTRLKFLDPGLASVQGEGGLESFDNPFVRFNNSFLLLLFFLFSS